jgi:hypothetical protein
MKSVMSRLERVKELIKEKSRGQKPQKSLKASGKQIVSEKSPEGALDVTEDMLNMFVRLEVQRRYFNIVAIEMLSRQFGMKVPSSINESMNRMTKIPISNLVAIGRNLTLEQYFEIKEKFESNPKAKAQMIKDR